MDTTDNPVLNDQYSIVHFLNGFFFWVACEKYIPNYSFKKKLYLWLFIHGLYELKDLYYGYISPIDPDDIVWLGLITNNSWQNTIADTIYSILGFFLGFWVYKNFKYIDVWKPTIELLSFISFLVIHIVYYFLYFHKNP